MSDELNKQLDFLMDLARAQGSASTTTTDGHLFILRKDKLQALLENNDSDLAVILVKKYDGTKN